MGIGRVCYAKKIMNVIIFVHAIAATVALCLGPVWILRRKNPQKWTIAILYVWIVLMSIVSISSYWIRHINDGSFSFIHILSVVTVLSICESLYFLYKQKTFFLWTKPLVSAYIGLVLAGIGTLLPGRLISRFVIDFPLIFGGITIAYLVWLLYYMQKK